MEKNGRPSKIGKRNEKDIYSQMRAYTLNALQINQKNYTLSTPFH